MAFKSEYKGGVPKGRLVPMYLTDEGDMYPIFFTSEEQLELVGTMIGIAMEHKVVVDTHTKINADSEKLSVYNIHSKKVL